MGDDATPQTEFDQAAFQAFIALATETGHGGMTLIDVGAAEALRVTTGDPDRGRVRLRFDYFTPEAHSTIEIAVTTLQLNEFIEVLKLWQARLVLSTQEDAESADPPSI